MVYFKIMMELQVISKVSTAINSHDETSSVDERVLIK